MTFGNGRPSLVVLSDEAKALHRVLLDIAVAVRQKQHESLLCIHLYQLHLEAVLFCKSVGGANCFQATKSNLTVLKVPAYQPNGRQ